MDDSLRHAIPVSKGLEDGQCETGTAIDKLAKVVAVPV